MQDEVKSADLRTCIYRMWDVYSQYNYIHSSETLNTGHLGHIESVVYSEASLIQRLYSTKCICIQQKQVPFIPRALFRVSLCWVFNEKTLIVSFIQYPEVVHYTSMGQKQIERCPLFHGPFSVCIIMRSHLMKEWWVDNVDPQTNSHSPQEHVVWSIVLRAHHPTLSYHLHCPSTQDHTIIYRGFRSTQNLVMWQLCFAP